MKQSKSERSCSHRHAKTVDPQDGLVAERETCEACGETLSLRLLYPPERKLMTLKPGQWPREVS